MAKSISPGYTYAENLSQKVLSSLLTHVRFSHAEVFS